MNHTQLLNHLIAKHNLKSYLEIGVQNPANNFNKINAEMKFGVDPVVDSNGVFMCTSDNFFSTRTNDGQISITGPTIKGVLHKFDLIFIDGLHHADQVKRDFENSLRCLNDGGFIVIHDCLPIDEITTCVPRGTQKMWHGDVYKFVMTLSEYYGIEFITYNFDEGCCVVWKTEKECYGPEDDIEVDWYGYKKSGHELMNIQDGPVTI